MYGLIVQAERLRELVRLSFDADKFKQANSTGYVGTGISPRGNRLVSDQVFFLVQLDLKTYRWGAGDFLFP